MYPKFDRGIASLIALVMVGLFGCSDGSLRGKVQPSGDGKTYFAVADDNGGRCGPLLLDGVAWPHPTGAYAEITPGRHTISCGIDISFEVPAGTRFAFDYWGP